MQIDKILEAVTPDVYEKLKRAVELRKWPDGKILDDEQLKTCMEAIIAFEYHNLPEEERTGFVPPKPTPCDSKADVNENSESPIKWK